MPYIGQKTMDVFKMLLEENGYLHKENSKICKENFFLRELLLLGKYEEILDFPVIDDSDYIVLMCNKIDKVSSFSVDFHIYDMGRSISNPITVAHILVHRLTTEIISIDTLMPSRRLGLGSICIKHIENFALKCGVKKIYGTVDEYTDIGKENLIHFYQKNGYTIYRVMNNVDGFKKEL